MKRFETLTLSLRLVEYIEESHEYIAFFNGTEVIVDPYVGCVWEDERIELGEFTFEGFWGSGGAFLPSAEL